MLNSCYSTTRNKFNETTQIKMVQQGYMIIIPGFS